MKAGQADDLNEESYKVEETKKYKKIKEILHDRIENF